MKRLRIGYLVQQFPPEVGAGPARVTEMAARWMQAGAEVTVITGMPNRPAGVIHPDYRGKTFVREDWKGIDVWRTWLYASPAPGFLRTVANNTSFMMTGALATLLMRQQFDVLIASSPPFFVHMAGEAARLVRRAPLVLEVRDLWPDYIVGMGLVRNAVAQRALFALERRLLRSADHTVVVTESFRRRVVEKGCRPEEVSVIPNGVDTQLYRRETDEPPPIAALQRREGEQLVGYLGNFGAGQGLSVVLEAAKLTAKTSLNLRFVLAGDGPDRGNLERHCERLGLANVAFHPPIPKEATRAFYNACDICLVPLAPIPIFQETIPSKIFEIMACERPVLASLEGEGAAIVKASGGGTTVPPGQAEALALGLRDLLALGPEERAAMGRNGRAYVSRHYARAALADQYLEILKNVASRGARSAA